MHVFGQTLNPATFYDGDGNGDCVVNGTDYYLWTGNFGQTGNADKNADFNRDGCVDAADDVIWRAYNGRLAECASRFEGDADGDGDVDQADRDIWLAQFGNCSGGGSAMAAGDGGGSISITKDQLPASPDVDGDGDVDGADLAVLDGIILGSRTSAPSAAEADSGPDESPSPTLVEPQP